MLLQQNKIQFSEYGSLYDLIVPKENFLRKINDLIDFSFVYDELVNKYCHNNAVRLKAQLGCLSINCLRPYMIYLMLM